MTESTSGGALRLTPRQVVCTLAERHYFYGVAALVNSLVSAGFEGAVVVGFRGERPKWLERFARDPKGDTYAITPSVQLRLIEVPGPWHLNNCKPHFIEDLLFKTYPDADLVYYFDTDMVITHSWRSFAQMGPQRRGARARSRRQPHVAAPRLPACVAGTGRSAKPQLP